MKKIKLDLETLAVESFSTAGDGKRKEGTVFGNEYTDHFTCGSCDDGSRLDDSCGATCGGACGPQTYAMHGCTQIE